MAITNLISSISRTTDYPVSISASADNNCGTLQLILDDSWTDQMIHELPAINITILTADDSKFLSFDVNMSTVNEEYRNKERSLSPADPYSIAIYDIPKTIKFSITPLFDNYALKSHNDLIKDGSIDIFNTNNKGIVDTDTDDYSSELWTTPTSTFNITINFDNSNVSSSGGGGGSSTPTAQDVTYDNSTSGLTANNVQAAIDELAGDTVTAADVSYSNTTSGLTATTVQAAIDELDNTIDNLPEPMVFKGSLGTGGTITTLPAASDSNKGFTYKVITAGTYASQSAKVGDTFISDGSAWVLIPSGDEPSGTVTNVAVTSADGSITVSGSPITSSGTIDIAVHADNALSNSSTKPLQNQVITNILTPISETEYENITTYTNPLYFIYEDQT